MTGYCEPGHQPSGSTKYKEFLDQLGNYSITPLSRTLVIRIANYTDRLGPSGKSVENSTQLTSLEITGYRIKYSTVLWLLEPQIRRGRKV